MRLAAAIAVIAVALAAAVYVHQRHTWQSITPLGCSPYADRNCSTSIAQHPSWEDPAAVLIAVGGIAVAAGILTTRRPNFVKPS